MQYLIGLGRRRFRGIGLPGLDAVVADRVLLSQRAARIGLLGVSRHLPAASASSMMPSVPLKSWPMYSLRFRGRDDAGSAHCGSPSN